MTLRLSALLAAVLALPQLALADTPAATTSTPAESTDRLDRIWQLSRLTPKGEYPSVKLRGRYHVQHYWVDAGDEGSADDLEHRRFRLGMDIGFTSKVKLSFDLNMDRDGVGPLVDNFDYVSLEWKLDDATTLQFGKLRRHPLTREDGTSSNNILTIERSLVAARSLMDNLGGVYVEHERGDWTFGGGAMSGSFEDDDGLALPTLDGGLVLQGNVAYQATPETELRLDYVFNDGDPDSNGLRAYRHMVSLNSESQWQRFGLITDIIFASALPQSRGDLYSVVLMPHYMLTPKLQLVGRYTYAGSDSATGVRLSSRYDRRVDALAGDRGDDYQAWYVGLNYYIYGHKLKLMAGVEHTTLSRPTGRYSGLTAATSLRLYF
jgi:phosphate-selective porin OprO/OprP